jgi:translation initiation factor 1
MSKKKLSSLGGLVYSTDPNFKQEAAETEQQETLEPKLQKLRVSLDRKRRAGKTVTLLEGFVGKEADLETLGKKLKGFCGTGGSVKDGEIIIQGDNRDKIVQWLKKEGYGVR